MGFTTFFLILSQFAWAGSRLRCQEIFISNNVASKVTWNGSKTDPEYKLAISLLSEKKEVDEAYYDPYVISFSDFVEGLKYVRGYRFNTVEDFVRWKTKKYSLETDVGTLGYKAMEVVVAVKLNDGTVIKTPLFLFDINGEYASHRELAMLVDEGFPQGRETYNPAWVGQYFAQIVVSKFKGQAHVQYLHTDNHTVRVHVQNDLDERAPITSDWGQILKISLK